MNTISIFLINFVAVLIGVLIGVFAAAFAMASRKGADLDRALGNALDAQRLDHLEKLQRSLLFNYDYARWAVIDTNNHPVGVGNTPRAAIDKARAAALSQMEVAP